MSNETKEEGHSIIPDDDANTSSAVINTRAAVFKGASLLDSMGLAPNRSNAELVIGLTTITCAQSMLQTIIEKSNETDSDISEEMQKEFMESLEDALKGCREMSADFAMSVLNCQGECTQEEPES